MNRTAQSLAVLTALSLAAAAGHAQVLEKVPSDALVVVKFNHLKATSDKVAKLAQDLGVGAFVPQLADPLGALEQQLNIKQGVDDAGEAAFVLMDPATVGNDPDKAGLVLVPVTDYKTFIANFPDAKTDAGVTEVDQPQKHFIADWGKYAAVSPNSDLLTAKPPLGLKPSEKAAKELDDKDAVLYANTPALKAKFVPQIQQNKAQWEATVEDALKNQPSIAKYTPIFKAIIDQGLNAATEFLNDAQAATVGIDITPDGINTTVLSDFTADSYIGKVVSGLKQSDDSYLTGLPDGKYLVYGGGMSTPEVTKQLVDDAVDPVAKEIDAAGPDMKPFSDYIQTLKAYFAAQKSSSFGVIAPTGAVGAEPLLQFFNIQKGDTKALMEAMTKAAELQPELLKASGPAGAAVTPTHTAAAKTLDGVSFDQIITKVDPNNQDPMAMQQAQMMSMLYGPQGAIMNYGIVGDSVLLCSGIPDALISASIDAIKTSKAPLADSDKVKNVGKQLPKERLAVVYIGLDDIVSTGMNYARQFGAGLNVQLPPDLPPIGVAASTDGAALKLDAHIPTTLVQSLVAAGMQAQMQMSQQRGGGAPN